MTRECVDCVLATFRWKLSFCVNEFAMHFMLLCVVVCCRYSFLSFFFLSTLPPFILDCCPQHSLHAGNVRAILDRNDFCIDVILREIAVCSIFSNNMIDVWKMQGKNCDKVVRNMFFLLIHSFYTHTHAKANTVISSLTIDACKSRQLRVSIYLLLFRWDNPCLYLLSSPIQSRNLVLHSFYHQRVDTVSKNMNRIDV